LVEKRKNPIKYEIAATVSIKLVLKETLTMLWITDPSFRLISKEDMSIIIKTAALDKISPEWFLQLFPATLSGGRNTIRDHAEAHSDLPAILPETTVLRRPAKPVGSKTVKNTPARN
jgi:hypothetical protein